jgi:hypothetical protein
MTYLDEILTDIHAIEKAIFNFDEELDKTMAKIEQIGFIGQVDHNVLFMSMLHQIRNAKTGQIHTLSLEEADQYYTTADVVGWDMFEPFAWTFWFFNMDKNYIRALVSFHADGTKSPKENYGIMYNELKPNVATKIPRKVIYETTIDQSGYPEIWNKLKEAVLYGKNNIIKTGGFNSKIKYDTATYFGTRPQDNTNIIDDEYKETMRPEMFKIPVKHIPLDVTGETEVLNVLRGTNFKQIDFEQDGYTREFNKIEDLNSYFYSIIDYVNTHVEEKLGNQHIYAVEKHYFSNKLPFGDSTKSYKVKITKFLGQLVIEAEVSEFGVYYKISNFNGTNFCENF